MALVKFQMKNYLLESDLESNNKTLEWDLKSVELLESLVKPTAELSVELHNHIGWQSMVEIENFIDTHRANYCELNRVRGWVYSSLLRKAVEDANAIAILRRESLSSQALMVWRSSFETDVVCQYILERSEDNHLSCRYVIHSVLRSTIRRWKEFNKTCNSVGNPPYFSVDDINRRKDVYKELVGEWGKPYGWTLNHRHGTFEQIAKATKSDMLFYRIANDEVHPNFGDNLVLTDLRLPLPAVPIMPVGVTHNSSELSLEFQTARILSSTTQRVSQFNMIPNYLQTRFTTLEKLATSVLRELSKLNP